MADAEHVEPKTVRLSDVGRRCLDEAHRLAANDASRSEILAALDLTEDELSFIEALEKIALLRTDPDDLP